MPDSPSLIVSRRGADRIRGGHPWVYRSDITEVAAAPGAVVSVADGRGRHLGVGMYSDRSQIALRMLSHEATWPAGAWKTRIAQALAFREGLGIDATAYRLVHAEGDRLPALIVDRYGDHLVLQALSQGIETHLPAILEALVELTSPAGVLARNDPKVRTLEGLDQNVRLLHGEVPPVVRVREGHVQFDVDLWHGQKTGMFLDQRENHAAAGTYARGRALDAFSYNGGFALQLASRADHVIALDASEEAVKAIERHAALNGVGNLEARTANVFDELRDLERAGERFDTIVLDPPAFAKSRAALGSALSGYKEINLRALKLLTPGGILVTCSCSYHVDEATFGQVVYEAAVDAHAAVTVVEKRMQSRDHPVVLGVPETYYLKCLILRRLP